MDSFELESQESVQCIQSMRLRDFSTTNETSTKPYFVVGTAYILPQEDDPSKGRILVFEVITAADSSSRKLKHVVAFNTDGCVYDVCHLENSRICCAVGSKVQLLKWQPHMSSQLTHSLTVLSTYYGHIAAIRIKKHLEKQVLVGDLMKSMTLLQYNPEQDKIEQVAVDANTNWMTAVDTLPENVFFGADSSENFFTCVVDEEAELVNGRGRMKVDGRFHLGEMVNKIRKGNKKSFFKQFIYIYIYRFCGNGTY